MKETAKIHLLGKPITIKDRIQIDEPEYVTHRSQHALANVIPGTIISLVYLLISDIEHWMWA